MTKLKTILKERDIKPAEFARETNIPVNIMYNLVNGKQYPYPGYKKKVSEALDMDPDELFGEV